MKTIIETFARNTVFANIGLVFVLLVGAIAVFSMVREELPIMVKDEIVVRVAYPGADPKEIEEGILIKIEEAIEGLDGINSYASTAREGEGSVEIELEDGADSQRLLDSVKTRLGSISRFPLEAEKPVVFIPVHREAVICLGLSSSSSERLLKEWASQVKEDLLGMPEISQIEISGSRDYEINIEIPEYRLKKYGLTLSQVTETIRQSNLNQHGGLIRTKAEEIRIRTMGRRYTGDELSSIVVLARPQGESLRLGNLATIRDGFEDTPVETRLNGRRAVVVNIYKTGKEDSLKISAAVRRYLERQGGRLPEGSSIRVINDTAESIRSQIDALIKNAGLGLVIVFILLWLFLNTRVSFWAGVGIVVSIVGGMTVLWVSGGTINMISIFGFIMVLGIVADDAIVVGEAIVWRREHGCSAVEAAVKGIMDVGRPVAAAVLTTVVAFVPLFFIDGSMGKLIRILPTAVIACLVISLLESFLLMPAHLSHLNATDEAGASGGLASRFSRRVHRTADVALNGFNRRIYQKLLGVFLEWRYAALSAFLAVALVALGALQGGVVKFDFFPKTEPAMIYATFEFPEGTPAARVAAAVNQLEAAMAKVSLGHATRTGEPLVRDMIALFGQMPDDDPGRIDEIASNCGGVQVMLLDAEKRGITADELIERWKNETGAIPGVRSLRFPANAVGQQGKAIEISLEGRNMETIQRAEKEVMAYLGQFTGIHGIETDNTPGKNEIQFKLKPEARGLGLTAKSLAEQIQAGYFGSKALTVQRGREEVNINVRYSEDERSSLSSLETLTVKTQNDRRLLLTAVADLSFGESNSRIRRKNGLKQVTVSADVDEAVIASDDVTDELESGFFREMSQHYPDIDFVLEGDAEESSKSMNSLAAGFAAAILVIFMIVATLFRSYSQPLVILLTLPFGVVGALSGHYLLNIEFTMLSIFGTVALSGIVVNDAIVLVERFNTNISEGMDFKSAVRQAGARRLRAVFLTSASTVGGLTPLMMETNPFVQMLIPVAVSIVFGVLFATGLTLFLIPCLLMILNDFRLLFGRRRNRPARSREEVEPARQRRRSKRTRPNSNIEAVARTR
ncbi:MAG: efflux RND transporter permease subunit [Proteobacteria bacterium]|nr:efflux RND transporter permease subunit [Pseudomonadota bacterium]